MTSNKHWSGYALLSILRPSTIFHSTNSHHFPLTCRRENHWFLYRMVQESDKRLVLRHEQPVLITTNTRRKTINRNMGVDEIVCQSVLRVPACKAIITYSIVIRLKNHTFSLILHKRFSLTLNKTVCTILIFYTQFSLILCNRYIWFYFNSC
jgi:hypothetical protein